MLSYKIYTFNKLCKSSYYQYNIFSFSTCIYRFKLFSLCHACLFCYDREKTSSTRLIITMATNGVQLLLLWFHLIFTTVIYAYHRSNKHHYKRRECHHSYIITSLNVLHQLLKLAYGTHSVEQKRVKGLRSNSQGTKWKFSVTWKSTR